MTDPTLYRDDSRVRHIVGAIERILEVGADLTLPPELNVHPPNMADFL